MKVKVGIIGNSLRVSIPQEIAKLLNIKVGDTLIVDVSNKGILYEKVIKNE